MSLFHLFFSFDFAYQRAKNACGCVNLLDTALSQTLQDTDNGAYQLDRCDVTKILYALDLQDPHQLIAAIDALHPADIADPLKQINPYYNSRLMSLCDREFDGEILAELKEGLGEEIIGLFKPDVLADAVHYLESDDVVNLIEDLGDKHQKAIVEV